MVGFVVVAVVEVAVAAVVDDVCAAVCCLSFVVACAWLLVVG